MDRRAYLACQFGTWVRSVVFGMDVSAKTISRKAAKPQKIVMQKFVGRERGRG
jgi:hypothetical protein